MESPSAVATVRDNMAQDAVSHANKDGEYRGGKKTRSTTVELKPKAASIRNGARRGREQDLSDDQPTKRRSARRQPPAVPDQSIAENAAEELDDVPVPRVVHKKSPLGKRAVMGAPKATGAEDVSDSDAVMNSVVKVFCTHTEFNFSLPWQRKRQYCSNSSGFVISGRRILTNAHSVDHHTQVRVKRRGSDKKYIAVVLAIGMECDIAMLTVHDEEFWEKLEPVAFEGLPALQDHVTVVGFPIGGDTMSVTSGVVSRIEVTSYVHGASELLGIQIDAAINSGNSGGPAFNADGACIGIAFQSLKHEDAENIGYIIPAPVINHFITDYERNGAYTGFPQLGIEWQKMENATLRSAMGMQHHHSGVMIRRVEPTCPSIKHLKQYDILMSFDGTRIANDGSVTFRSGERISFSYLVSQKYTMDTAEVEVLSNGKVKTVTLQLSPPHRLVPFHIQGKAPSYFIIAGLVFTAVTVPYLKSTFGRDYDIESPVKLLDKMQNAMAQKKNEQVVVLSQVLAAEINVGYEDICNSQVSKLNGKPISNLRELVNVVDSCMEGNLHFDLDYNSKVILPVVEAKAATKEILETHCIPCDRSPDLVEAPASVAAS